jgi:hypothetical protein
MIYGEVVYPHLAMLSFKSGISYEERRVMLIIMGMCKGSAGYWFYRFSIIVIMLKERVGVRHTKTIS